MHNMCFSIIKYKHSFLFQRYGYDGFVQLHHHCKVRQRFSSFPVCMYRQSTGYRRHYTMILHTMLETEQVPPGCILPCGPVSHVSTCRTQHGPTASVERFAVNTATTQQNTEHAGSCVADATFKGRPQVEFLASANCT